MKEVHLQLPRDVLRSLLDGKQQSVSWNTDEHGEPIRVTLWAAAANPEPKKFGGSES
jgi:hypothetical protein